MAGVNCQAPPFGALLLYSSLRNEVLALMKSRWLLFIVLLALVGGISVGAKVAHADASSCLGDAGPNALLGSIDGAKYKIEVPANWNGTLVLYSHGYEFPGSANPYTDVGDPITGSALLSQGYALAGSSYSQQGWALQQAFHDQIALLNFFDQTCGQPTRTIAWGHSLGGIITAGLVQLNPDRFSAALPMCGVVAGGVGTWNQALDGAFAFDVLLAGNSLPIVHLNPKTVGGAFNTAEAILAGAQGSPQGQARLAMVAALGDTPGWFDPTSPEPAATDYAAQEYNQFLWDSQVDFPFLFFGRLELEIRAGGNPSWNTDVNYRTQLERSANFKEVKALYQQAGLSLDADLDTLAGTPRIAADPGAVNYLSKYIVFNGNINIPVLTMHTTGDGLVVNQDEQTYRSVVDSEGNGGLLRQIFVHRAGHCSFSPAETLAAFQTLIHRLNTGRWGDSTNVDLLNQEAAALGPGFNLIFANGQAVPAAPAFIHFEPTVFLRPYVGNGRQRH